MYCEGDFNWLGQVWGGGGGFYPTLACRWKPPKKNRKNLPSLAVRWLAPTTHSISCLDSSLGRVPACDAGDPGSIPGGRKLNACPLPGGQLTSTHSHSISQCCGSGSGIWCLFDPGIRNRFFPDPGSQIPDPNHIFLRTYWQFWFKKSIILWKLAQIFFFSSSKLK